MRNLGLVLLLCLGLFMHAGAAPQPPLDLVQDTTSRMLERLEAEREVIQQKPERLYDLIQDIVVPHFDFERMAQLVLGKHWRRASPEQRGRFVEAFRTLLVRTYGSALNEYRDQEIHYEPVHTGPDAREVVISTEVEQPSGIPIPIDYRMHLKDGAWKVYDVIIDGVSLVTNYRTSFNNEISQGGLDGLIQKLVERNRQAST